MNWTDWGPTIIAVITAVFTAGMIAGRIRHQETALLEQHGRLDLHDVKLEVHAIAIAKLESWKEGYNAGATRIGLHGGNQ